MSVRYTNRRERIRRADGTRVDVPGGDPSTGLGARTRIASQGHPISGAAIAAAHAPVIEPVVDARIVFETTADRTLSAFDPLVGGLLNGSYVLGLGSRHNPAWAPAVCDVHLCDDGRQVGPEVPEDTTLEQVQTEGAFTAVTSDVHRFVPNPEGSGFAASWALTGGGVYSRASAPSLPALGLPGDAAHIVTTPVVGSTLTTPWQVSRYELHVGRVFTVAGWVDAPAGMRLRLHVRFRLWESSNAAYHEQAVASSDIVMGGGVERVAAAMVLTGPLFPTSTSSAFYTTNGAGPDDYALGDRIEVSVAVEVAALPAAGPLKVRGLHAYAGPDRGDEAGLAAMLLTDPQRLRARVTDPFPVSRVDVYGVDGLPGPVSFAAYRALASGVEYAFGASPLPRMTARWSEPATPDDDFLAYATLEEVNAGEEGEVTWYVMAIEAMREVDLADRIVELTVDRTSDADPADSTVPIGNYAAGQATITLDNADRSLSPFRADYVGDPAALEVAIGVVYTNRHNDPYAEGLDPAAWPKGTPVPVVADRYGAIPPGAVRMIGTDETEFVAIGVADTTTPRVRVSVWTLGEGLDADAFLTLGLDDVDIPAGSPWTFHTTTYTIPSWHGGAAFALLAGGDLPAYMTCPVVEVLDPATDDVIEVVEDAPAGVFRTVDWPTSTDSDVVTVTALDVLAEAGGDLVQDVAIDTTLEQALRDVFRRYLDLGDDQVVIGDDTIPLPYILPAPTVATMIADLAKAGAMTVYADGAGRAVARVAQNIETTISVDYREDNALIRAATPLSPDLARNDVTVVGHPVAELPGHVVATLGNESPPAPGAAYVPNAQAVYVPPGETVELILEYGDVEAALGVELTALRLYLDDPSVLYPVTTEAVNVYGDDVHTIVIPGVGATTTNGAYDVTFASYATFAVLTVTATPPLFGDPWVTGLWVDWVQLTGLGLAAQEVRQRYTSAESIAVYGRRPVTVDVRLGHLLPQLAAVGVDVLANYSLRDATGERWLPDLEATTLGDPWREVGDRVLAREPVSGLGGEFRVVSHALTVGEALTSALYLRRVATGEVFAVADVHLLDDDKVLTY